MTPDELREVLAYGAEQRSVEFKSAVSLKNSEQAAVVVRAMMGMANRRDGGKVVLGVDDVDPVNSPGVDQVQAQEWTNFDDVADQIGRYADPMLDFTTEVVEVDGRIFVVLDVDEFRDQPIICKKTYQANGGKVILQDGDTYMRSTAGKIETTKVRTADQMRELVDLAATKKLARHIEMTAQAGGIIVPADQPIGTTADQAFADELGTLYE